MASLDKKSILLIYTCEKNLDREEAIRNTWLQDVHMSYKFVTNQCTTSNDYLNVNCIDTYEALAIKTFMVLKWFVSSEFDILIKIDDDTFINTTKLNTFDINYDYTGLILESYLTGNTYHQGKCTSSHLNEQQLNYHHKHIFAAGGCYTLTKRAAKLALLNMDMDYIESAKNGGLTQEDRMIGRSLHKSNITVHNNGIWVNRDRNQYSVNNAMAIHPVCTRLMYKLKGGNSDIIMYNYYNA